MQKNIKTGFVLLYVVLIVSASVAAASLVLATQSVTRLKNTEQLGEFQQARYVAMSCAEELLMDVRNDVSLVATGTFSVVGGDCSYVVSGTDPNKTIIVSGEFSNVFSGVQIVTSATSPTITATWIEGDF